MNNEVSDLALMNPSVVRLLANRLYQARGAYLTPYKDLRK
jgi:hypothetical protein